MRRLKKIDDDWLNGESVSEKIIDNGITSFSDKELLKMALSDNSSLFSDSLARDIVNVFDGYSDFNDTFSKLSAIEGLDVEKAIALASMVEFARRRTTKEKKKATNPQSLFETVRHYFDAEQERFIVVGTNGAGEISFSKVVTIGLLDKTIVHPREVYADAIKHRCSAIMVAHNHPSGYVEPSEADILTTIRLQKAGELLGVQLLDHLIFSEDSYYSFREHDKLQ